MSTIFFRKNPLPWKRSSWHVKSGFRNPAGICSTKTQKKFSRCRKVKKNNFSFLQSSPWSVARNIKKAILTTLIEIVCWKPEKFPLKNWKKFDKFSFINEMCFTRTFSWTRIFTSEKLAQNFSPNVRTDFAQSPKTIIQIVFFHQQIFPPKRYLRYIKCKCNKTARNSRRKSKTN